MARSKWIVSLALCLFSAPVFGFPAEANLIANISGRTTISLDGMWHVIVDPYDTGFGGKFFENRKPKNPRDFVEYDFDGSPVLNVPGDWNSQRDSLLFYEGTVWYKKSFTYRKREGIRTFLYFGAANYQGTVYLNGKQLGSHVGGFTPFNFEVTESVVEGDNFLIVAVNDARHADGIPALSTDWWNYGGLTRDVALVEVPSTFIQDYFVQMAKGSTSQIAGWIKLNGSAQSKQVTLEIPDAGVRQELVTGPDGVTKFQFTANLKLWSPENPHLYRVLILTATDKVEDQIGFRTIETRGTKILLNGQPVFLRGIAMHEEAPFRSARAFSVEDDGVLLGWAKELGCNFVRLAHYPYNEPMLRLADRLGLLVWSEVPVYWNIDWTNPATLDLAEETLRDSITRDHNRASIILWSVANETPVNPDRTNFIQQLTDYARQLDGTRLLTAALNRTTNEGPFRRLLNDPLGQSLDVLGLNEYIGWYEGTPDDAVRIEWQIAFGKPVVISEFGAGAPYGDHGAPDVRWTEEYQAHLYECQIQMIKQMPFVAGMSPWVLMDFRSPRRTLRDIQDYHNRKGLISDRGQRKQAFYILQKYYRQMIEGSPRP